jgi:hypothetical protein
LETWYTVERLRRFDGVDCRPGYLANGDVMQRIE